MILNPDQAVAVITAMAGLNNVCGRMVSVVMPHPTITGSEIQIFDEFGRILVQRVTSGWPVTTEVYESQSAFLDAYAP